MGSRRAQAYNQLALLLGHGLAPCLVCPLAYALIFGLVYRSCGAPAVSWKPSTCDTTWAFQVVLLVLVPAAHLLVAGPIVWIKNTVSVRVDVPLPVCSQFIRDARNLSQYEQKVSECHAFPGGFTIWGSWFGLPFAKTFDMRPSQDGGFHSSVRQCAGVEYVPSIFQFEGSGGFRTVPDVHAQEIDVSVTLDDVAEKQLSVKVQPTRLLHYESYGWPISFPYMPFLALAWRVWHRRGMEVEMELIKTQIEHIFRVVHKGSVDGRALADESHFAADYPPPGDGQKGWGGWKYGADDYLKETLAKALCRPYTTHHPSVKPACWKASSHCRRLRA